MTIDALLRDAFRRGSALLYEPGTGEWTEVAYSAPSDDERRTVARLGCFDGRDA
jgi:hypothetical protein